MAQQRNVRQRRVWFGLGLHIVVDILQDNMSDNVHNGGIDAVAAAVAGVGLDDATEPGAENSPAVAVGGNLGANHDAAAIDAAAPSNNSADAAPSPSVAPEEDTKKFDEFHRLESFALEWPDSNYNKADLAREGIYFDSSRCDYFCAFCDVQFAVLGQADESIRCRHQRLSPECPAVTNTATNNRPLEPANNFKLERHRRVSFLRTNWTAPVDPRDLAKWGFYWTGSADRSRCIFCTLVVRGWEPGDSGEREHRGYYPHCPFLMGQDVGNVVLGAEPPASQLDAAEQLAIEAIGAEHANEPSLVDGVQGVHYMGNQGSMTALALGLALTADAKHPENVTKAARRETFTIWPRHLSPRPQDLVDAGFFYAREGDRVFCFHCGGGLAHWTPTDQPWVEHAKWYKDCAFVNLVKGRDFVAQVQRDHMLQQQQQQQGAEEPQQQQQGAEEEEPREGAAGVNPIVNEEPNNAQGQAAAAPAPAAQEPPRGAVEEQRACRICVTNEVCIVFLPCGHMSACADCGPQLSICPICRAPTQAYVRTFLP